MGMADRDWYREKRIDWERGGLKDRRAKRRRNYLFWIAAAVIIFVVLRFWGIV